MERHGKVNGQAATFATYRGRIGPVLDPAPGDGDSGGATPSGLLDCLDRLTDRIDQLEFTLAELAPAEGALDRRLDRIEEMLTALRAHPADGPDLGPLVSHMNAAGNDAAHIREQVDGLTDRMAGLETRIDAVADAVAGVAPDLTPIHDAVAALRTDLTDGTQALSGQITTAEKRLGSTLRRKAKALPILEEIRDGLRGLAERADAAPAGEGDALADRLADIGTAVQALAPTTDSAEQLAEQRREILRLGNAIAQMQKRLESNYRDRPTWVEGLGAEIGTVAVTGMSEMQAALAERIADLGRDLTALSEAQTALKAAMHDISAQAPVLDMTPTDTADAAPDLGALLTEWKSDLLAEVQRLMTDTGTGGAASLDRLDRVSAAIETSHEALSRHVATLSDWPEDGPGPQECLARFDAESARFLRRLESLVSDLPAAGGTARIETVPAIHDAADPASSRQLIQTVSRLAESNGQLVDIARATPDTLYARQEEFLVDLRSAITGFFEATDLRQAS